MISSKENSPKNSIPAPILCPLSPHTSHATPLGYISVVLKRITEFVIFTGSMDTTFFRHALYSLSLCLSVSLCLSLSLSLTLSLSLFIPFSLLCLSPSSPSECLSTYRLSSFPFHFSISFANCRKSNNNLSHNDNPFNPHIEIATNHIEIQFFCVVFLLLLNRKSIRIINTTSPTMNIRKKYPIPSACGASDGFSETPLFSSLK